MKVILKQSIPKVGKEGQVVTVANGYARNFLFPRGLAVVADKGQLRAHEARRSRVESKLEETKSEASSLKEKIDGVELRIEGRVAREGTKLFGAITAQDVADALKAATGITLEKKQVLVVDPIKRLGEFPIQIDLHRDVDATVKVVVFDPAAPTQAADVEPAPEPEAEQPAEAVEA